MRKILVPLLAASVCATSASAVILTDPDFTAVTTSTLPGPDGTGGRMDYSEDGDEGWKGSTSSGFQESFDTANDLLTLANGSSFAADTNIGANDVGFGQWNTDNSASTGQWSFEFEVTDFDFGAGDSLQFVVRLYSDDAGTTFGDDFELGDSGFGNNVSLIGQVETGAITGTGTFSTGFIDLGSGFDRIGVGIWAVETNNGGAFGDSVTLASVTAVPIPEPSSLALLGIALGGVTLLRSRRRSQ